MTNPKHREYAIEQAIEEGTKCGLETIRFLGCEVDETWPASALLGIIHHAISEAKTQEKRLAQTIAIGAMGRGGKRGE